jgi:alkaline phosphatase
MQVRRMLRLSLAFVLALSFVAIAQTPPRNVILFLADAGGIPTISAASLHGYGAPMRLFVQRMANIGLSDTSPVGSYVTDSAAGMTAIVTGQKTRNGVISQSATAERKVRDGEPLKTILEYAEERGLSTGIITNDAITGATPAALYAKANDRGMTSLIFQQIFTPRFGDGPDIVIGAGRPAIAKALVADGLNIETVGQTKGRPVLRALADIPPSDARALVVLESGEYDLQAAVDMTVARLSQNARGYFLMVEWDTHTDNIRRGLDRFLKLDGVIARTAQAAGPNTLILFTADHSFDLRVIGGSPSQPLLAGLDDAVAQTAIGDRSDVVTSAVRMQDSHTGEEVLVAAQGPGAARVHGYLANTDLFGIMMEAFGWKAD